MNNHSEKNILSYADLLASVPCGALIVRFNERIDILCSNEKLWRLFECESEQEFMEFCEGSYLNTIAPIDREGMKKLIRDSKNFTVQRTHRNFYRVLTKTGRQIEVEDCGGVLPGEAGEEVVCCQIYESGGMLFEATELNDKLTGLYSMSQFLIFAKDILQKAEEKGEHTQYTFVYYNIRNFKFYNIKYGRNEGDRLLREMARQFEEYGTEILTARLGEDHFVSMSKDPQLLEAIKAGNRRFDQENSNAGLTLKAGLYRVSGKNVNVSDACDLAKIACDMIHDNPESVLIYDENLEQRIQLENYIVRHFEEALEKHYIKPHYQPIIRTISGSLCGLEALARWFDPKLGLISPGDFIPVLEKNNLITKLDIYMLRALCADIREAEQMEISRIPVSFNLSKLDFTECDIFETIEEIVLEYGVAREFINIEITESIVMGDPERLKREIARLQEGGYYVWMDDFGSGFSSLNVLKEYSFNEIKLDICFLREFDERAKQMLRSLVQMSKRLGIHTLAEGVETKEQFEFLTEIGCEKVQGFYFSKAVPKEEVFQIYKEKRYVREHRALHDYYEKVGGLDFTTDRTFAIYEYDGERFSRLFANKEYLKMTRLMGTDDSMMREYIMNSPSSAFGRKFRDLQKKTAAAGDFFQMDFSMNGRYFRIYSKRISECLGKELNQVEIELISSEADERRDQLDYVFRMMYSMYDTISLIREDGSFESFMQTASDERLGANRQKEKGRRLSKEEIAETYLHPDDRAEFLEFADWDLVKKRFKKIERGFEIKFFRSKRNEQDYVWKAHSIQYAPDMKLLIYATRSVPLYQEGLLDKLAPGYLAEHQNGIDGILMKRLKDSEIVKLFWIDQNGRFAGANKGFLKYYGIENLDSLIGKTGEEDSWYLDFEPVRNSDRKVLKEGVTVQNELGRCIKNGILHTILISKEPIYHNGKIIGMLGQFVDVDELSQEYFHTTAYYAIDELTGLLSAQGMVNIVSKYLEGWKLTKKNFAAIRITFQEQKDNYREYGSAASQQIAVALAKVLRELIGNEAVAARLYAGNYVLLKKCETKDTVQLLVDKIHKKMKSIHQIAEYHVTILPEIQVLFADQMKDDSEMIAVATGGTTVDLAERERFEEKLAYYNIQLETVVDAIPGGIAMYEIGEKGTQVIYASQGVGKISGRTTEEFTKEFGKHRETGMLEADIDMVNAAVQEAVQKESELDVTYRLKHVDGKTLWVNMKGKIIGKQNGHPLLFVVFRNLSESTSIYESALDEALVGVIVRAAKDGEILYINQIAKKFSTIAFQGSAQAMYTEIRKCCIPENKVENRQATKNSQHEQYEVEYQGRNLVIYHIHGNWNGREASICYVMDVTAKYVEEREKAARESLLYLQAISTSYDILVTYNLTKNTYLLKYNKNYLGYQWEGFASYEELLEFSYQVLPKKERNELQSYCAIEHQLESFQKGNFFFENEHQAYDITGTLHWVRDRLMLAEDPSNGDILGISMSQVIDERVRERNEQKEALQRALDEALKANQAKSRFLSNMSHDIRTPMNAILGYTSIAMEHEDDPQMIEDSLKKILFSGKHLQDLINDILDMSRIEAGREELVLAEMSFQKLREEVFTIMEPLAKEKQIQLEVQEELYHEYVYADDSKIRRILINIMGNAVKFTDPEGTISCTVKEEESKKEHYARYTFCVTDNGIGMSEEFLSHIFESFAREKTATISHKKGTGLGMSIAKKYVELMNGEIRVESKQKVGTKVTVVLELEVTEAKEQKAEQPVLDAKLLRGKKGLLVEDNELNIEIATIILREMRVPVVSVTDGQQAVERLSASKDGEFDFVLMDMQMPVMDGVAATKEIRSIPREYLKNIPIVAVTANAFSEDLRQCEEAGMNGYITKPYSKEELTKTLLNLLNK